MGNFKKSKLKTTERSRQYVTTMKAGYNTIPSIEEGESQSLIDNVEILEAEEGSRGYTNKKKIRFALVLLAISFLICYRTILQHSGLQMSKESKELVNNSSEKRRMNSITWSFCRRYTVCWTRSKNGHCPFPYGQMCCSGYCDKYWATKKRCYGCKASWDPETNP